MEAPVQLIAERGSYRLTVNRSDVDYYQFQQMIGKARELRRNGELGEALRHGLRALALWRGRPLDELRTGRADNWRRRVRIDEWIPANATVIEILLDLGEATQALSRLNELQADHPSDLSLAKLRLATLRRLGRDADGSAYYFDFRKRLRKDGDDQAVDHLGEFYDNLIDRDQPARRDPSPTIGSTVPWQLPHDIADFVGREQLLSALDSAFITDAGTPRPGVLVLDGMAGVGKTALAVRWGHRVRDRFPAGTLYLDLQGFSDQPTLDLSTAIDLLLAAFAPSPDVSVNGPREGTDPTSATARIKALRLSAMLSGKRTLVVLDNVRDSEQVLGLLPLLADAVVLITSRRQLTRLHAWKGARRTRVEPMSTEESSALLVRRLSNDRRVASGDLTGLASLCGGIPLATILVAEHAAARPSIGLLELTEHMRQDRCLLVIGEDGDGSAGLRTLFSYSFRGLPPAERRLFSLLGCHPGHEFSGSAAAAIDGRSVADTRRSLDVLVSAHLLDQLPHARYRHHDLIRDYARHVAIHEETPCDREAAERRMLGFYLASARNAERQVFPSHSGPPPIALEDGVEPVKFIDPRGAMTWCLEERLNIDAAIGFAVNHGYDSFGWRLPHAVSAIYERLGLYTRSLAALDIAVVAARRAEDLDAVTASWQQLGLVHLTLGNYTEARRCLREALRVAEETRDGDSEAYALHSLARLEVAGGEALAGIRRYRQCLDLARRIGNLDIQCWTHYRLGEVFRSQSRYDDALPELHWAQ